MMQAGRSLPSISIVIVILAWMPPSLVRSTDVSCPAPRIRDPTLTGEGKRILSSRS
jgi:hypothetical protein